MEEAFLNKNLSMKDLETLTKKKERKNRVYNQMYGNFAKNYEKTLERMLEESQKYWAKKAVRRQVIHKNEDVDNIQGRERFHFLIEQMKEMPYYQKHLKLLSEEL